MKRISTLTLVLVFVIAGTFPAGAQSNDKGSPISAANAAQVMQVAAFQIADPDHDGVSSVAFSPDGSLIAVDKWNTVQLWDVKTGQSKAVLTGPTQPVVSVAFSPDGSLVASGSANLPPFVADPMVWLWDVKTGQPKTILQRKPDEVISSVGVVFSPDGKLLASAGGSILQVWDLTSGRIKAKLWSGDPNTSLAGLAFSPDGSLLAGASPGDLMHNGSAVQVWDIRSGRLKMTLGKHKSDFIDGATVAFSPDGSLLAAASDSGDFGGTIRLWDVKSGKLTATLLSDVSSVKSVAFSPDGSLLAAASGGEVILWNVETDQIAAILKGHTDRVTSVAFSPDGTLLASGGFDHMVRLWGVSDLSAQTPAATDSAIPN